MGNVMGAKMDGLLNSFVKNFGSTGRAARRIRLGAGKAIGLGNGVADVRSKVLTPVSFSVSGRGMKALNT